jgi:hypothetical protein
MKSPVTIGVDNVRPRRRGPIAATTNTVTAALALLCDICGGRVGGGAVSNGAGFHCSLECAQVASGRVPGNYLG